MRRCDWMFDCDPIGLGGWSIDLCVKPYGHDGPHLPPHAPGAYRDILPADLEAMLPPRRERADA